MHRWARSRTLEGGPKDSSAICQPIWQNKVRKFWRFWRGVNKLLGFITNFKLLWGGRVNKFFSGDGSTPSSLPPCPSMVIWWNLYLIWWLISSALIKYFFKVAINSFFAGRGRRGGVIWLKKCAPQSALKSSISHWKVFCDVISLKSILCRHLLEKYFVTSSCDVVGARTNTWSQELFANDVIFSLGASKVYAPLDPRHYLA